MQHVGVEQFNGDQTTGFVEVKVNKPPERIHHARRLAGTNATLQRDQRGIVAGVVIDFHHGLCPLISPTVRRIEWFSITSSRASMRASRSCIIGSGSGMVPSGASASRNARPRT